MPIESFIGDKRNLQKRLYFLATCGYMWDDETISCTLVEKIQMLARSYAVSSNP